MDKQYELKYHDLEVGGWWFKARREMVHSFIGKLDPGKKVLDIGCSSGVLMQELQAKGVSDIKGIDISEEAIRKCQAKGLAETFVMDAAKVDFPDESFDLLIASDCMEHIKNDEQALVEWLRILKPEGKLILFVPAFQFLWTKHDDINHHFRRYTQGNLGNKINAAGFTLLRKGYWNIALFIPIALLRFIKQMFPEKPGAKHDDLGKSGSLVNMVLLNFLRIENILVRYIHFPFGVSTFAVAEKK